MADDGRVQVMNIALGALGKEPVRDLSDASIQKSAAAFKLLRHIELSRDAVLSRQGWLCALEYKVLTPNAAGADEWRYPYFYRLPGDTVRVWAIGGIVFQGSERECWGPRWQVGSIDTDLGTQKIIRSRDNQDSLNVAYVRRAAWQALDAALLDAIGHELAGRACYSVNGDMAAAKALIAEGERKIMIAIGMDGTQEGGEEPLAPSIPAMIRAMAR